MDQKLPGLNPTDLEPYFNREDIIQDCVAQVKKDFGMYGFVLDFEGSSIHAYDALFKQLEPIIAREMNRQGGQMQALLYRIDVSEKKVREAALEDESWSASITRMILWRELQKVVIRRIMG